MGKVKHGGVEIITVAPYPKRYEAGKDTSRCSAGNSSPILYTFLHLHILDIHLKAERGCEPSQLMQAQGQKTWDYTGRAEHTDKQGLPISHSRKLLLTAQHETSNSTSAIFHSQVKHKDYGAVSACRLGLSLLMSTAWWTGDC